MSQTIYTIINIFTLLILVLIIGFFSSSETAFLALTNIKVRQMLKNKQKGIKKVAYLKTNMDNLLTVVLIGTNFVNTLAASIATTLAVSLLGNTGIGIATIVITFVVTIFGSIVPKTIAGVEPEKVATKNAPMLYALNIIFFPLVWFFSMFSKAVIFIMTKIWKKNEAIITEEELKTLIDVGESEGTLETNEKTMLNRIIKISDLHIYNIMKHRSLITPISINATRQEAVELFKQTKYSRLPVYENSKETIVGVLDYKNVLFNQETHSEGNSYIKQNMSEPLFIPETFSIIETIQSFREKKQSFAVALDEQGCTSGIITRDDVLRAVFGSMTEEYANTGIEPELRVKVISSNEFIIPGDLKLTDVNNILNLNLESNDYNTLGGWLLEHFDALPSTGEALKYNDLLFIVKDQAQRRIQSVLVRLNSPKLLQAKK